ncbi:MAG: amino acid adenylation domain-containing protein, partial [Cytophagales bacterium]|nr:amino acid adenylation domain-containing protein [Cytophagales bacterium]
MRLDKSNVEDIIGLTPLQEGLLFYYLHDDTGNHYAEQVRLDVSGKIDLAAFREAWGKVVRNNELLRTVYRWEKMNNPAQVILKHAAPDLRFFDFSGQADGQAEQSLLRVLENDKKEFFDLQQTPFRVTLCRLGESRYQLVISNHHILFDGWSRGIILREFMACYQAIKSNVPAADPPKSRFSSFLKEIKKEMADQDGKTFWQQYLKGYIPVFALPSQGAAGRNEGFGSYKAVLDEGVRIALEEFLKRHKLTFASVAYGVWGMILQKYNGTDDVVTGIVTSGRNAKKIPGIENMVGLFINTLPLRVRNPSDGSVLNLLQDLQATLREKAFSQSGSLTEISRHAGLPQPGDLFNTLVAVENFPLDYKSFDEVKDFTVHSFELAAQTHYDLTLMVTHGKRVELHFLYNAKHCNASAIARICRHVETAFAQIIADPHQKVSALSILPAAEKQLLGEYNQTARAYPKDSSIGRVFSSVAAAHPDKVALVDEVQAITYRVADDLSDHMAAVLRRKGVGEEEIVGVLLPRTPEMVIALLGVLKAGAAYLPLDPAGPPERTRYMLEDASVRQIITTDVYAGVARALLPGCHLTLTREMAAGPQPAGRPAGAKSHAGCLAYVMYTSGTAGQPKGVLVEHGSVLRLVLNTDFIKLSAGHRLLLTGALGFDATIFEMWSMLLNGGTLHLLAREKMLDVALLAGAVRKNRITVLWFTSSWFNQLADEAPALFDHVEYLLVGGESLSAAHIRKVRRSNAAVRMINGYGPTENTTFSACYPINGPVAENIPIGRPVANSTAYVLDAQMRPLPLGLKGELWVGGDGLARGYLNQPALTAEKFRVHAQDAGQRVYRTGDYARWNGSGNLEYLGRMDDQVKIRGFRIELQEIQNRIKAYAAIDDAVVVTRPGAGGEKQIAAYLKWRGGRDSAALNAFLAGFFPGALLPVHYIDVAVFPLTANGKIDADALPAPALGEPGPPAGGLNETEARLATIWAELLEIEAGRIGAAAHFFALGGHSLKAIRLLSHIHKQFGCKLPAADVFNYPTLGQMAERISRAAGSSYRSIGKATPKALYPLSPAQEKLFILQSLDPTSTAYNMPFVAFLSGELDYGQLQQTFTQWVARHESLRTGFGMTDGVACQQIEDNVSVPVGRLSLAGRNPDDVIRSLVKPFEVSKAPLLRVTVVDAGPREHLLFVDMHHLICDGHSQQILTREFAALYAGLALPPVPLQYRDYSEWRHSEENRQSRKSAADFWDQELAGPLPVLELPYDFARPLVNDHTGATFTFDVPASVREGLERLALQAGSTLYLVMLSCYYVLLRKLSNQEDIVIGVPVFGRHHADLEGIVGMFVNTLPVRNYPTSGKPFARLVSEVKEKYYQCLENQDAAYETSAPATVGGSDISRNPLFDVIATHEAVPEPHFTAGGMTVTPHRSFDPGTAKFDLGLHAREARDRLSVTLEYSTQVFKKETIERFTGYLANIFAAVAGNPAQAIAGIAVLSPEEQHFLLEACNATGVQYEEKPVHQWLEQQAAATPDRVALVEGDHFLTYGVLNAESNRLAHALRKKGVNNQAIVGLMAHRSAGLVAGVLGILKAGAAYLPIDPELPGERIRYLIKDSGMALLLHQGEGRPEVAAMNLASPALREESPENPEAGSGPGDLAYVLYTSGSTGLPKGVMVEHGSVNNVLQSLSDRYPCRDGDSYLFKTSFTFDVSVTELLGAFYRGGRLVILPEGDQRDGDAIITAIRRQKVTHVNFVPSMFNAFMELLDPESAAGLKSLAYIFLAGEALSPDTLRKFSALRTGIGLENLYGPTEATIYATGYSLAGPNGERRIPIGTALANTQALVLSGDNTVQPVGVPGELLLGGRGIARGYLNRPELTAEKFIAHPYYAGSRGYKTGDLAYTAADKNVFYLGRLDTQVKMRGFRIEPGEVEAMVTTYEGIREAVVVLDTRHDTGNLCAFFRADGAVSHPALAAYLSQRLPFYMVPQQYVQVEQFPGSSSGKIDRGALLGLLPQHPLPPARRVLPESDLEKQLVTLWQDVLGRQTVGTNEHFFALGGDSIKALQVIARLNKAGYRLPMKHFLLNPTIAGLAAQVTRPAGGSAPAPVEGKVSLSPIQQWFFSTQPGEVHHFNQGVLLVLRDPWELGPVTAIFEIILRHHDALRATFRKEDGKWEQVVRPAEAAPGSGQLVRAYTVDDESRLDGIVADLHRNIDLASGPLLKAALVRTPASHYLAVVAHHLVIDAVSWYILLEDLGTLLKQYEAGEPFALPAKTDSCQQWVGHLRAYADSTAFVPEKKYWAGIESTEADWLTTPGESGAWKDAVSLSTRLDAGTTSRLLHETHHAYNTNTADLLLTGLSMSLDQVFGLQKVLVDCEGHGREPVATGSNVSRTVGWFTSLHPVVLTAGPAVDTGQRIRQIKENVRQVPNKGIGYGILKYLAAPPAGGLPAPRPQILFNYLGQSDLQAEQAYFKVLSVSPGPAAGDAIRRTHPLEITCSVANGQLVLDLAFDPARLAAKEAAALLAAYGRAMEALVAHCAGRNFTTFTPHDHTFKHLSMDELDRLNEKFGGQVEDVFALTPMQGGILFHALYARSNAYFAQCAYRLEGDLRLDAVRESFAALFRRHEVLRGRFVSGGLKVPVQVILRQCTPELEYTDLTALDGAGQQAVLDAYRAQDKSRSFDLQEDVLMRARIFKLGAGTHELVWSFHHIIMDGWCIGVLSREFFQLYAGLVKGSPAKFIPPQPYKTFLRWLSDQPQDASRSYWRTRLEGFGPLTGFNPEEVHPGGSPQPDRYEHRVCQSAEQTDRLRRVAARNNVTLNTLIQTVWAVLLGKYNDTTDVVFGGVVSGRPAQLPGVESMVGLFINTIPVRVKFGQTTKMADLFRQVQRNGIESEPHHYCSLAEIQAECTPAGRLLDHVLVFENYPLVQQLEELARGGELVDGIRLSRASIAEHNNYPFSVSVFPREALELAFKYSEGFTHAFIEGLGRHFTHLLDQVTADDQVPVGRLQLLTDAEKNRWVHQYNATQTV